MFYCLYYNMSLNVSGESFCHIAKFLLQIDIYILMFVMFRISHNTCNKCVVNVNTCNN